MDKFYARVCYNTRHWRWPSGDAALLEAKTTQAGRNHFGYEEWLFNFTMWNSDGYHYGFLQPVKDSLRTKSGQIIDVLLWAIDGNKRRVYVGEIKNCEVLSAAQSGVFRDDPRAKAWLELMKKDLSSVNATRFKLLPDKLFNIRFRPNDAIQYDPLTVAKSTDRISTLRRYKLVRASASEVSKQWKIRTRQGQRTPPVPLTYIRGNSKGRIVDPYHPVLQKALMVLLQKQFGKGAVERESGWVDLKVNSGKRRLLIEIKTDVVAKRAVRQALGQILEYAFFRSEARIANAELYIVAPGRADEDVSAYLELLRTRFGVPVRYCQFLPDADLPDVFKCAT